MTGKQALGYVTVFTVRLRVRNSHLTACPARAPPAAEICARHTLQAAFLRVGLSGPLRAYYGTFKNPTGEEIAAA